MYAVAIIGAGASGMHCASLLNNPQVAVIEQSAKPAQKLKVSGGGKCNITNRYLDANHFVGDKDFIQTILNQFTLDDTLDMLQEGKISYTLNPKIVKGTYFLNKSTDLIEFFLKHSKRCSYYFNTKVSQLVLKDNIYSIHTNNGVIKAKNVVIATGGISYAQLGCSDIGYKIAKEFGHGIQTLSPALVGFTVQKEQFWFKNLSGISLKARSKIGQKELEGDILFTHKGISGPLILSTSLYWQKGLIELDFCPRFKIKDLKNKKQNISNALPLPKRFVKDFLKAIQLEDKPLLKLSLQEWNKLQQLHSYKFAPAGNFGYSKAEVTKGGIETKELTKHCESKKQKGLYFLGELLDVTGELGGYNIQWALSTAYASALKLQKTL